jgi:hypothetical protein
MPSDRVRFFLTNIAISNNNIAVGDIQKRRRPADRGGGGIANEPLFLAAEGEQNDEFRAGFERD